MNHVREQGGIDRSVARDTAEKPLHCLEVETEGIDTAAIKNLSY